MSLEEIMGRIRTELDKQYDLREKIIVLSRESMTNTRSATMAVHNHRPEEAKLRLDKARQILDKTDALLKESPLLYVGALEVAYQEFAEASILHRYAEHDSIPSHEELRVNPIPYLMGLADAVGEMRRMALDSIRTGDIEKAESTLEAMDHIFVQLSSNESAQSLESQLRKKIDTDRHLVEITRGDVTLELRQESLRRTMNQLQEKLS